MVWWNGSTALFQKKKRETEKWERAKKWGVETQTRTETDPGSTTGLRVADPPAGMIPMRREQGTSSESAWSRSTPWFVWVRMIKPCRISLNIPSPPTHTTLTRKIVRTQVMTSTLSGFAWVCNRKNDFWWNKITRKTLTTMQQMYPLYK